MQGQSHLATHSAVVKVPNSHMEMFKLKLCQKKVIMF